MRAHTALLVALTVTVVDTGSVTPLDRGRECSNPWPAVVPAEAIFVGRVVWRREHSARAALFSRAVRENPPVPADSSGLHQIAIEARVALDSIWRGPDSLELTVFTGVTSEAAPLDSGA